MRRTVLALVALLVAVAVPASAQTPVDVIVGNGGDRTLYVEDMLGNELETLDFGALRTLPFRVRVVDDAFDRDDFTVLASMTNLYPEDDDGDLVLDGEIASGQLEIVNPLNPLNVTGVSTLVQPVFDISMSVTGPLCGLLGFGVALVCEVDLTDVEGKLQELDAVVDLANLANLPLVPQAPEEGSFDVPDWVGDTLPAKPGGAPAATQLQLLSGDAGANDILAALETQLDALVASADLDDLVDVGALISAVQDETGALLEVADITALLGETIDVVAEPLALGDLLYQTGTYTSYPMLRVTVPEEQANGTYRGTLVVTGIQP